MKSKLFLFALLTLIVFACDEPETKDRLEGNWKTTSFGPLQPGWTNQSDPKPAVTPALVTTFTITRSGNEYTVSNVEAMYGETKIQASATINGASEHINTLKIEGSDFFINMSDIVPVGLTGQGYAKGATFKNPGSATIYNNTGASLSRLN